MEVIADLHIHSRFSMACSKDITIKGMESAAVEKGINLLGSGDFTHPLWLKEMKAELEKVEGAGLYKVKGSNSGVSFIPSVEVSTIFQDHNKTKKVHNVILTDDIEKAEALNSALSKYGDLSADGRPTLMMSAAELVETVINIDGNAFVFPAHAWTPWFGVFGSMSGFDSMREAYEDQERRIYALETGLSSDPVMNWRISANDKYALLSNSDFHSLQKMGREANVFELERVTYGSLIKAIKDKDAKRFIRTLEFYPEEGKYHFDGHRNCNFSTDPAAENGTLCPICRKRLTIGVLHRVNDLADRPLGYTPKNAVPYAHVVPLIEILSYVARRGAYSLQVKAMYNALIRSLGPEFTILTKTPPESIAEIAGSETAEAIRNVRSGRITAVAGYDGVFGRIEMLERSREKAAPKKIKQPTLSSFLNNKTV